MKVLFIALSGMTVDTMMRQSPYKSTYDPAQDQYLHWLFAVLPCGVLAIIISILSSIMEGSAFSILKLFWSFSILLEAIAILPQLITLQNYREVENLTGNYIFFMVRNHVNGFLRI